MIVSANKMELSSAVKTTLILSYIAVIDGKFNELYCEESVFYKPYVRFYKDPEGDVLFEANTGFRALDNDNNVYVCINGPLLLYTYVWNTSQGERAYMHAKFGMFIHQCLFINLEERKKKHILGLQAASGRHARHSLCSEPLPTRLEPYPNAPHLDSKIWGMYILGEPADYRKPSVTLFYDDTYEIRTDAANSFNFDRTPIRTPSTAFGLSIVTVQNPLVSAGNVSCLSFHGGPGHAVLLADIANNTSMHAEPRICFRQQSRNDTLWESVKSYSDVALIEVRQLHECNNTPIVFAECINIPDYKEECRKKKPDPDLSCLFVHLIMGEDVLEFPKAISWHLESLNLCREIFNKACPWVPKYFTSEVATLIGYYVQEAEISSYGDLKISKNRRPFWSFIVNSLKECLDNVEPMSFSQSQFVTKDQFKRDIRFSNKSGQFFQDVQITFFKEKADKAFEFNRVIEMQWTMFSTVLGICPMYYRNKTSSISSQLYTFLSEDFLNPLSLPWVNPAHNLILEFLLPNYVNDELHLKAQSCMEASYIQSNTVANRFLRPLTTNCDLYDNQLIL